MEIAEKFLRDKGIIYEWTFIDDKIIINSGDLIKLLFDFSKYKCDNCKVCGRTISEISKMSTTCGISICPNY